MIKDPFFLMIPDLVRVPVIILALFATIIASQAVISGAFSLTQQAIQLGFMPRMQIKHTSATKAGQIYIPVLNWGLMVMVHRAGPATSVRPATWPPPTASP